MFQSNMRWRERENRGKVWQWPVLVQGQHAGRCSKTNTETAAVSENITSHQILASSILDNSIPTSDLLLQSLTANIFRHSQDVEKARCMGFVFLVLLVADICPAQHWVDVVPVFTSQGHAQHEDVMDTTNLMTMVLKASQIHVTEITWYYLCRDWILFAAVR